MTSTARRAVRYARLVRAHAHGSNEFKGPLATRAADDCFEHGDGNAVGACVVAMIARSKELARAVLATRRYQPDSFLSAATRSINMPPSKPLADIRVGEKFILCNTDTGDRCVAQLRRDGAGALHGLFAAYLDEVQAADEERWPTVFCDRAEADALDISL